VAGPRKLRFTVVPPPAPAGAATGAAPQAAEWIPSRAAVGPAPAGGGAAQPIPCGADGTPGDGYSANHLCATAPTGALIGKIGGSTADKPDAASVFAVGQYCIRTLKTEESGALFLTMNDVPGNFAQHDGVLKVRIEEAP